MEIRIRETGQTMLVDEFRALHNNVSFPSVIDAEILNEFGADPVLEGPTPSELGPLQVVERDGVELIDGNWFKKYRVVNLSDEASAAKVAQAWASVRLQRNGKLAASDWTQLADAPLTADEKTEWATKRQAWRDITNQSDPFNVVWPDEPLEDQAS